MSGLVVAGLLALREWPVTVVDEGRPRPRRLDLVSPRVARALAGLGLDPLLDDPALARPTFGIRRRWGRDPAWRLIPFLEHPGARAYVVDRTAFDAALRAWASEAGATIVRGRVAGAAAPPGGVALAIRSGAEASELHADVVVDATGRAAHVARRLGARRLVLARRLATRLDDRALPVRDRSWLNLWGDEDVWNYRIEGPGNRAETWRVAHPSRIPPGGRPVDASTLALSPAAGPGWIAVGDAALAFDPLTAQGLSHAVGSGLAAAGALLRHRAVTADVAEAYTAATHASRTPAAA